MATELEKLASHLTAYLNGDSGRLNITEFRDRITELSKTHALVPRVADQKIVSAMYGEVTIDIEYGPNCLYEVYDAAIRAAESDQ